MRITPAACILIWAVICRHETGELVLNDEFFHYTLDKNNSPVIIEIDRL